MDTYELPSVVSFDNLVEVRDAGEAHIEASAGPVFDLGRLEGASSAVVALMVAWFRYAHGCGKTVRFINVPEGVMNIVEVAELADLLPIEESATATIGQRS